MPKAKENIGKTSRLCPKCGRGPIIEHMEHEFKDELEHPVTGDSMKYKYCICTRCGWKERVTVDSVS
jgi:ribosomal protein S27AE